MKRWIHANEDYMISHQPTSPIEYPDEVATADKITDEQFFPSDILDRPEKYFRDYYDYSDSRETVSKLKAIQGNPDALITIYRGAPSGGVLHTGNWVTPSYEYAKGYAGDGMNSGSKDAQVYCYKVKAKDLSFDGDSIFEFGYWGPVLKGGISQ